MSSDRHTRADCLVLGGGMVGATLAAALGGAGLDVVVLDRAEPTAMASPQADGRTTAIAHGSKVALDGIGVWPLMASAAEPILDIRVSDADAPAFLHFDHTQVGDAPLGYIVENADIRGALYRRIAGLHNVRVMAPTTAAACVADSGRMTVTLDDGNAISAELLVAADGANSWARRQADIRVTQWSYDQISIVCTMTHARPHRGVAHERFLPGGPFAALPMRGSDDGRHRSSIVWTETASLVPALMALDDAAFSTALAERFGPWYGEVAVDGQRWTYPLRLQHAEKYTAPRLALVGDAAHVIHPIAGQGWNMGLRDVAALAEVIVDARRLGLDIGGPDVLARYQRWRRFDNVALSAVTDSLNRLFSNAIPPVQLARDAGLGAVNAVAPLRKFFMRHAMGVVGTLPRLVKGEML